MFQARRSVRDVRVPKDIVPKRVDRHGAPDRCSHPQPWACAPLPILRAPCPQGPVIPPAGRRGTQCRQDAGAPKDGRFRSATGASPDRRPPAGNWVTRRPAACMPTTAAWVGDRPELGEGGKEQFTNWPEGAAQGRRLCTPIEAQNIALRSSTSPGSAAISTRERSEARTWWV